MTPHFEVQQGTPEWHAIRYRKISGTSVSGLFAKGATSDVLLNRLVAEFSEPFSIEPEGYKSDAMIRGHELEPVARQKMEEYTGLKFVECGWLQSVCKIAGMSPDGITLDLTNQIEIKCPSREKHTKYCRDGVLPAEHAHQCVYAFTINPKLDYIHFGSFRPENEIMPLFVKTITRDITVNLGTNATPVLVKVGEHVKKTWELIYKMEAQIITDLNKLNTL